MHFPLKFLGNKHIRGRAVIAALPALFAATPALGESAPRIIETRQLKLIGDGTAPAAPPAQAPVSITTLALRLIGDGAGPPANQAPTQALIIETRPLKLIGTKP
jgi:hypothetical protein